ncbi:MAG: tRNA (adenosine(37)-N6)-threonylcarbamoyltransferase complex dimerization subunit type 1 TsaB [Planctomycetota bacterium]
MTFFPLLAIETSSRAGSVALMHDAQRIDERALGEDAFQGRTLAPRIDALLKEHRITPDQIGLVAVGLGPGSFTGLRVGIAFARGFAYAVGCDMVGVSSLAALALAEAGEKEEILCIGKAGHDEFFYASFRVDKGRIVSETEPAIDSLAVVQEKARSFKRAIGEGAAQLGSGAESISPAAGSVAVLGARLYAEEGPTPERRLLPLYLRRSNAEINWERRQGRSPG